MLALRAREETPTSGSQTVTATRDESAQQPPLVLRLQAVPNPDERRVTWDEEVIDNENMGKKSSKGMSVVSPLIRSVLYLPSPTAVRRVFLRGEFIVLRRL
jgi:hypothetical protein